eukprot:scaffold150543_cov39-Tisochrysis_lutea.AAC.1
MRAASRVARLELVDERDRGTALRSTDRRPYAHHATAYHQHVERAAVRAEQPCRHCPAPVFPL